jgi:VRR-NUC domain
VSESDLYAPILAEISHGPNRLFRQNSGLAWQGTVIERTQHRLILAHPRPLKMGAPGLSDLGGWSGMEINEEMIGRMIAVYTGIEVKSRTGRATPEQLAFIDTVRRAGGRAGVARSVEEARKIIIG